MTVSAAAPMAAGNITVAGERPPRRAYVTLLASGGGGYLTHVGATHAPKPDYIATITPMICSFKRAQSLHPLIVLAVNLTASEQDALRALGGDPRTFDVIDVTPQAARLTTLLRERQQPRDCRLQGSGWWIVWNRFDFDQTMFKALLWSELAGRYDEVAFFDVDVLFRRSPDKLFEALTPGEEPPGRAGRGGGKGHTWWLWHSSKTSGCGNFTPAWTRRRRLCARLDFVAPESSRELSSMRIMPNRSDCTTMKLNAQLCEDRHTVIDSMLDRC